MVGSQTASFVRKTKQKASYIGFCRLLLDAEACRSLRCSTHDLTLVRRRRCPAWFDPHRPQQFQESKYSESYVYGFIPVPLMTWTQQTHSEPL